jgi:hypothetical protein
VSQSIIRTALTNKALRLELEYREPALIRGNSGDGDFASPAEHAVLSDELRCFLMGIESGELL